MQYSVRQILFLVLWTAYLLPLGAQQIVRTTEEEVNTQKVFIDANREKILGNFENAVYLYKEVLKRDKSNHAAAYELARVYDVLGNDEKAIGSIKLAISLDKANPWYQMFQADLYDKNEKFKEAAKIYEGLAKSEPNNEFYYSKWAFFLVKAKDVNKAIKVYNQLEEKVGITEDIIRKKQSLYIGVGNIKKAIGELQSLIDAYPSRTEFRHDLAEFYIRMGEPKKAKAVYEQILAVDPSDGKAAIVLAGKSNVGNSDLSHLESLKPIFRKSEVDIDLKIKELIPFIQKVANSGDRELASASIELTKILANVHPNDAKSYSAYGDLLYYSGQTDQALEKYQKAIDLNSNVFTIWEQVMYIQTELKDYDGLLKTTEKATDFFPNQAKSYYFAGIASSELSEHSEAIQSFQQAMMMSRKNQSLQSDILKRMGVEYFFLKKYERSDKAFTQALEINPNDYIALANYGFYLAQRGDRLEDAKKMTAKANKLLPNQASFQDAHAWVLYKMKDYKNARDWMSKALQNGGDKSADILEHFGDILFQLDETDEAIRYWQLAMDKGSRSKNLEKKITDRQLYE